MSFHAGKLRDADHAVVAALDTIRSVSDGSERGWGPARK